MLWKAKQLLRASLRLLGAFTSASGWNVKDVNNSSLLKVKVKIFIGVCLTSCLSSFMWSIINNVTNTEHEHHHIHHTPSLRHRAAPLTSQRQGSDITLAWGHSPAQGWSLADAAFWLDDSMTVIIMRDTALDNYCFYSQRYHLVRKKSQRNHNGALGINQWETLTHTHVHTRALTRTCT